MNLYHSISILVQILRMERCQYDRMRPMNKTYSSTPSGLCSGSGRADHLAKISPALVRVKPHHSIAATLSWLSGRSNGACAVLRPRTRTDAEEDEPEERLPCVEGGPRSYVKYVVEKSIAVEHTYSKGRR